MRTIQEIKKAMTDAYVAHETVIRLYKLEAGDTFEGRFSKISLESILFYVCALSMWALEGLFYKHKAEVAESIAQLKPHSLRWYRNKTLGFMYGKELVAESDYYDVSGMKDEDVNKAKVVKYCAVSEDLLHSTLLIKVAGEKDGKRGVLSEGQTQSLTDYLQGVKDAGVYIEIVNRPADRLWLALDIYYNPLILSAEGTRLDGNGDTPVADTVKRYIENLPFNGELTLVGLVNALQAVEGVVIPNLKDAYSKYGAYDFVPIVAKTKPDSGYFAINEEQGKGLEINYISYEGSDL